MNIRWAASFVKVATTEIWMDYLIVIAQPLQRCIIKYSINNEADQH
jgi:hypothetical protein